jgi:hypothetical protein
MSGAEMTIDTTVRLRGRIIHANAAPGRITALSLPDNLPGGASLTGKQALDLHPYYGPVVHDQPMLAIDRVRYRGEPVAVVAGSNVSDLDEMDVRFETTPVSPVATGAKPGETPLVHVIDLLERAPLAGELALNTARTNRLTQITTVGRSTATTAASNRIVTIAKPLSAPDLPLGAAALWRDDLLSVWTPLTDRDEIRRELATITGHPEERIQLLPAEGTMAEPLPLPGAIGVEAIAVAIARRARQPVEVTASRSDFGWSGPRAVLVWDERGNATLTIDAGAVAGYLPLWLDDFARLVAERTAACAMVTAELIYSAQPPVAASRDEWIGALTDMLEAELR